MYIALTAKMPKFDAEQLVEIVRCLRTPHTVVHMIDFTAYKAYRLLSSNGSDVSFTPATYGEALLAYNLVGHSRGVQAWTTPDCQMSIVATHEGAPA